MAAHHLTAEEATAALELQTRVTDAGTLIKQSGNADAFQGFALIYAPPCFHVQAELTSGDGSMVTDVLNKNGYSDIIPYLQFRVVKYSESQLSAVQRKLPTVLGDLLSASDQGDDKVIVGVWREADIPAATQKLQQAIDAGVIDLPIGAFDFRVMTGSPL